MTREQIFIAACNRINRYRALTDREVDRLEECIYRERRGLMSRRQWTMPQLRKVEAAVRAGVSYADAGKLVGRSGNAVSYALRNLSDLPRRSNGRPRKSA